jgi:hypothetical protein
MDLRQVVLPSPQVISQEVAGETVLLDLESEHYFGLDPVGTRIWQLMAEQGTLQDIVDTMMMEYQVAESQLVNDLRSLVDELQRRGLATLGDARTP